MRILAHVDLESVSAAAWLPYINAEGNAVLPVEIALGVVGSALALFLIPENSYCGKVGATAIGFALGWIALPAYKEAGQGFPYFHRANVNI